MSDGHLPRSPSDPPEILITVTIHDPISWSHGSFSRASQHIILASQTLGDLLTIIPCASNELPDEIVEVDRVSGYDEDRKLMGNGEVLCIEDVAYGDGKSELDYAEHVSSQPIFLALTHASRSKLLLQLG